MAPAVTGRAASATRLVALGSIRIAGMAIAIGAGVAGVAYLVGSIVGDMVWYSGGMVLGGGFASGLPLALRAVNGIGFMLWCLTIAVMAGTLAELARRVRRGVRFDRAVSNAAWMLAGTLAFGAVVAEAVWGIAMWSGLLYPDTGDPASVDRATLPIEWAIRLQTLTPNWGLLGLAIVLAVLAYVIRAGERLQRDAEGLV